MNIAIVGSRPENMGSLTENDKKVRKAVFAYVATLPKDTVIVSGGASGVDSWAEQAARHYGLPKPIIHKPQWKIYGKSAGMVRNRLIVRDADCLVAFWNGFSSGTRHSIMLAEDQGKRVIINPEAA